MTEQEKRALALTLAKDALSDFDFMSVIECGPVDMTDDEAEEVLDLILGATVVMPT